MRIGVAKEIKSDEYRVALTPAGALELINRGHEVTVETGAGVGKLVPGRGLRARRRRDRLGRRGLGAQRPAAEGEGADRGRVRRLREGLMLFTYLHIAADEPLTRALVDSGVTAVAYETVEVGRALPLLAPMSEVAGGSRRRRARTSSRSRSAAAGSCSAACRESRPGGS